MFPSTRDVDIKSLNHLMHFIQSIYLYDNEQKKFQGSKLKKERKKNKTKQKGNRNPENNGLGIFNSLFRKYARWQAQIIIWPGGCLCNV